MESRKYASTVILTTDKFTKLDKIMQVKIIQERNDLLKIHRFVFQLEDEIMVNIFTQCWLPISQYKYEQNLFPVSPGLFT